MAYDDLPLHSPDRGHRDPARRSSPTRGIMLGAAVVIAGSLLALWWMSRAQPGAAPPVPTPPTDPVAGSHRPNREPLDLPTLDDSDTFMRDLVATLSRHPLLTRLLATPAVVRGGVLAVIQIGDGKTPAVPLAALRPGSRLAVAAPSGRIDPQSYVRWNDAAAALTSISPTDAAQVYVNVKPLFDQAYRELGYPGGDFDAAIVRALRTLLATPDIAEDPVLLRRPSYFEHEDPTLRALPPVQKQLLLLGPENRRRTVSWLRQFAAALDLKVD